MKPPRATTHFGAMDQANQGPPSDPAAAAYAAGMAARAAGRQVLPKYTDPVGGVPAPPIPRLDQPSAQNQTMAQQAEGTRGASPNAMLAAGVQRLPSNSIVEPPMVGQGMPGGPARPQMPQLAPTDMLPQEATQDPEYRQGPGSMYAMAQPHLAVRYGIVRNGQRIPAQMMQMQGGPSRQPTAGKIRPETVQDLQALQALQQHQAAPPAAGKPTAKVEEDEEEVKEADKPLTDSERKNVEDAIQKMDSFDYNAWREAMNQDLLNNPDQRKIIRARCAELDVEELIVKDKIFQEVPIVVDPKTGKNKFWVLFASMTGEEDLALKRLIMKESKSVEVTERYLLDKYSFMSMTCGVTKINSNPAPTHLDAKGDFNDDMFWLKFNWMMKRPLHMLGSIGLNYSWFEMDVRKLFVAEKLGNG